MLEIFKDVFEVVDFVGGEMGKEFVFCFVCSLFEDVIDEVDIVVLGVVLGIIFIIVVDCSIDLFDEIVSILRGIVFNDRFKFLIFLVILFRIVFLGVLEW